MTERFFVDVNGAYLGAFDGVEPPKNATEVQTAPLSASMTWDGFKWAMPDIKPKCNTLSRRQLRRGLLSLGVKSTDVEAKIADLPEDQREIALIDWQDASEYERSHPLVSMLGTSFGLTDEQIDEAWLAAQEL